MALEIKENTRETHISYTSVRSGILQVIINDFFTDHLFEPIRLDYFEEKLRNLIEENVKFEFKLTLDRDDIFVDMNIVRGTILFEDGCSGEEQRTLLFSMEQRGVHYNEGATRL